MSLGAEAGDEEFFKSSGMILSEALKKRVFFKASLTESYILFAPLEKALQPIMELFVLKITNQTIFGFSFSICFSF